MKQLLYITLTLILAFSCKPSFENEGNKKLYDEVMVVHDDVMPRMSEIHKLKKSIRNEWKDSSKESYAEAMQLIKALEDADESMMNWMSEFKVPKEASDEATTAYLNEQKVKITAVSDEMNTSIAKAELFLNQYK